MNTYLLINGRQQGPYSNDQVQGLLSKSVIQADCLAWTSGLREWKPLHSILTTWREHQASARPRSLAPGMGVIAMIIGAVGIPGWPLLFFLAALVQSEAFLALVGLSLLAGLGMNLVGAVLGFAAMLHAKASKSVAIVALCLNALELVGVAMLLFLGMMLERAG